MAMMALEPETQEDVLLEGFLALETPEGFRAELIDGEIVVTPPPAGDHEDTIDLIAEQVYTKAAVRFSFSGHKGLLLPSGGKCPKAHLIPDGTFAPRESRLFRGAEPWMPPDGVVMVAEVTSSRPEVDRGAKRHCYARALIPFYLLVDQEEKQVTLFSEPERDDYHQAVWAPYGKPLTLPEPFDFELDTSEFV
ncbi:Uma2 family endonuclease [Actinomadura sp. 21ATH]|uniref:Uma2 family endonuclease n=1 Tax=Actinomadura sp. 21ATH TaxID=1735444 RepID=UPI0035C105E2